ncbi:MAG TPA: hypothetical protein VM694_27505, partial [Polyangium sp.]|nr:hypothetical protein [Polyangium sp.]
DQARPGPKVEELRIAQFFQRAGGKTTCVRLELATGTLPLEPSALRSWWAGPSSVLTLAVR